MEAETDLKMMEFDSTDTCYLLRIKFSTFNLKKHEEKAKILLCSTCILNELPNQFDFRLLNRNNNIKRVGPTYQEGIKFKIYEHSPKAKDQKAINK